MRTAPRDVTGKAAKSRMVAEQCAASKTADLLPDMTTANTARDLDRIREALGERKISFYGVSYGSYVGAAYASMFPAKRTGSCWTALSARRGWRETVPRR